MYHPPNQSMKRHFYWIMSNWPSQNFREPLNIWTGEIMKVLKYCLTQTAKKAVNGSCERAWWAFVHANVFLIAMMMVIFLTVALRVLLTRLSLRTRDNWRWISYRRKLLLSSVGFEHARIVLLHTHRSGASTNWATSPPIDGVDGDMHLLGLKKEWAQARVRWWGLITGNCPTHVTMETRTFNRWWWFKLLISY